jgi:uncharacterized OB-fold protein
MIEHIETPADWTVGTPGITYQRCGNCSGVWYFRREFCPTCGSRDIQALSASGSGTVHASTLVHRAPSDEFRALAPYSVVLVDIDEGFRMMGHGDPLLQIGERVRCRFQPFADRLLPFFEKDPS